MWGSATRTTHSREGETGHTKNSRERQEAHLRSQIVQTKLEGIADQARRYPDRVFTTLYYQIDDWMLHAAFREIKRDRAAGVDKRTAREYMRNLETNIASLYERLRTYTYRPHPVKRVWLEKEGNKKRPIGIPCLEDKIVGRAVSMLLESIYENDFHYFSYGFRPNRNQHMALKEIWDQCTYNNIRWIVDADVQGFFDSIDHKYLREILKHRMNDGRIRWLIDLWLKAGVWENGHVRGTKQGVAQGSVVSPILANIFLHTVLDDWFVKEIQPRLYGRSFIVRFCDDFLIGCEDERDARRIMKVLPKRFSRFNLTIHPEKTQLVKFCPPDIGKDISRQSTFDFLGFTHYWAKSLRGRWVIKRKTMAKRLRRCMRSIWIWCRENRHWSVPEQWRALCSKLRGHYIYYGIRCNYKMLEVVYEHTIKAWKRWLGRRTRSGQLSWEEFNRKIGDVFPLPRPRIIH